MNEETKIIDKTTRKKVSPSFADRMKKHKKICDMYLAKKDEYENATQLYLHIASKIGCHHSTVIRVLQLNNLI